MTQLAWCALQGEVVSNHDELMCNFFAQADALATGRSAVELRAENVPDHLIPHKTFTGNRPSLSILLPELNAFTTGQILAMYEHRVAVQVGLLLQSLISRTDCLSDKVYGISQASNCLVAMIRPHHATQLIGISFNTWFIQHLVLNIADIEDCMAWTRQVWPM